VEIQKILQGLLRERVSIRNMVSILESIANYAPVSKNIWFLTEKARQADGPDAVTAPQADTQNKAATTSKAKTKGKKQKSKKYRKAEQKKP
jgi:flagellar biosynthesis component FlhA